VRIKALQRTSNSSVPWASVAVWRHSDVAGSGPVSAVAGRRTAIGWAAARIAPRASGVSSSMVRQAIVLGALLLASCAHSTADPTSFEPGERVVVAVEDLEQLRNARGYFKRFAEEHSPFWLPTSDQADTCEALLSGSRRVRQLRAPLRAYHLQLAGVTHRERPAIRVHGFCPQGPGALSYPSWGRGLTFAPFHTGRCYFEAYCLLDAHEATGFEFGTRERG